jgi:hypothetical protein
MQTLTSWKDIAVYLDKSVRTVQRWENEAGLPVRRAGAASSKGPVFAIAEEIDAWVRTRPISLTSDAALRDEIERLRRENEELRERLRIYEPLTSAA